MNARTMVRTLAVASMVALAVVGSPAGLALAGPNSTAETRCKNAGYVWDDGKKACAKKECTHGGTTYTHGEERAEGSYPKLRTVYKCDGFTGEWVKQLEIVPSGPVAPKPTTIGR